jgi:hypothetical protein
LIPSTRKVLDLINTFRKVAGYKIKTQKSVAFLYTNNKYAEKENRKTILYTTTLEKKNLQINLTKEMKDLYNEIYKTLKREIKEDTIRWKNLPCSLIGKVNIMKMVIYLKVIFRFI